MKKGYPWLAGFLLFFSVIQLSCGQQKNKHKDAVPAGAVPGHYDLNNPEKYNMPDELLEISGIAFVNGDASKIYAEQDEDGNVYQLKLGDRTARHTQFGKHGDYEDITIMNSRVYMLRSDGTIYNFPLAELSKPVAAGVVEAKHILPVAEYEGLYADQSGNKLYVLLKNGGKQTKDDHGFILTPGAGGQLSITGGFDINVKEIARLAGSSKIKFHPSALAKHPLNNDWYILSSVNKVLVVANASWQIKAVYPLNHNFLQPEGIAFDKSGNLYISNEGDTLTPGNVLKFAYRP